MATFEEEYKKYSTSGQGQAINDMYDAQKQSQLTQLESAYQASRAEAEAARDKLPGQYRQQANDLAAQYERNRRNFNLQADASGLNTGAASQAALAQNSAYQRDMGALRTSQAEAMAEADRGLADLERQYQANVSSAIADNDYQRAQALMNEYNNGYSRDLNTAKTLAAYGDFSGYAGLYGQETADSMAALWKAQNPELAYNTGRMTAEEYKAVTGKYPAGYSAPYTYVYNPNAGTGGGGGGGKDTDETESTGAELPIATMDDYTKMIEEERAAAARAISGANSQADMLARQAGYQRGAPGYDAFVQTYLSSDPAYAEAKAKQAELDSAYYSGTTKGQQEQAKSSAVTAAQEAQKAAAQETATKKKIDDFWENFNYMIENSANHGWYGGV